MTSTRDLTNLPEPNALQRILPAYAMLDAILEEEWAYRYYSFNSKWDAHSRMGSMRNGSGDDFFVVFDAAGCFIRGFDHEAVMSPWRNTPARIWPGVLDQVPAQFAGSVNQAAFHMEDTTFCLWWASHDSGWAKGEIEFPEGEDPDGSKWMLSPLVEDAEAYRQFAADYFELEISLDAISRVLRHEPLSAALLSEFPTQRNVEGLIADAEEIDYPIVRDQGI